MNSPLRSRANVMKKKILDQQVMTQTQFLKRHFSSPRCACRRLTSETEVHSWVRIYKDFFEANKTKQAECVRQNFPSVAQTGAGEIFTFRSGDPVKLPAV